MLARVLPSQLTLGWARNREEKESGADPEEDPREAGPKPRVRPAKDLGPRDTSREDPGSYPVADHRENP